MVDHSTGIVEAPLTTEESPYIKIATYNILSGRNGRLEMALREADRLNIDFGFFTEAKLTNGIYTRRSPEGYSVFATEAVSPHKGGIALFWRDRPNWSLESQRACGPNVISCELKTPGRRFLVVGAYISPSEDDCSTMQHITTAVTRQPGLRTIILGDFNVDLVEPSATDRDANLLASIADLGMENAMDYFRSSRRHRDGFTWRQVRDGQLLQSRCDSILCNCPRDFLNVQIRSPRGHLSDHDAVCGWIRSGPSKAHKGYLHARKTLPWTFPDDPSEVDIAHACLQENRQRPETSRRTRKPWISDATWRLVDNKAELRRQNADCSTVNRLINHSLRADRKCRVEAAGTAIEAALRSDDLQEVALGERSRGTGEGG